MTANNDTYLRSVKSAEATKTNALAAAQSNYVSSLTAATCDIGHLATSSTGFATYDAAVRAANAAKLDALWAAERAKQAAIQTAKDLIHSHGEAPT